MGFKETPSGTAAGRANRAGEGPKMGVHATFCLICGLPVQHDHYVASGGENCWAIYRAHNKPAGHFPFGTEHDWLLQGVAVSGSGEYHFGRLTPGLTEGGL